MDALPNEPFKEDQQQKAYYEREKRPLLLDILDLELAQQERIVVQNDHWLAVVPFWAIWPFEILLLPRRHILRLPDLVDAERSALADILKRLLSKYDNLFETSFPYSMGWHGAPFTTAQTPTVSTPERHDPAATKPLGSKMTIGSFTLTLPAAPALGDRQKFMVGFEMLGEAQRDLTAEQAAARLRDLPDIHYKQAEV